MIKEDAIHILSAMKKSYMALGIPDPEAVGALEIAIKAIQTDNSEKVYQKAFEDIKGDLSKLYASDNVIFGLNGVLEIIDKHNPDKGKERENENRAD